MNEQERWERALNAMSIAEVAHIWGFLCRYLRRRLAGA